MDAPSTDGPPPKSEWDRFWAGRVAHLKLFRGALLAILLLLFFITARNSLPDLHVFISGSSQARAASGSDSEVKQPAPPGAVGEATVPGKQ
jgi:hypothetical protein